jgi:Ca2+-binding EF-hand superfamily protein
LIRANLWIVGRLDQQHESGVNLLEFVAATLSPEDASNEVYLRSAFEILDRNDHDGITCDDLKGMFFPALALHFRTSHSKNDLVVSELLGSHFDEAACHEMIKRFDVDKDGKVGFEDFTKMMKVRTLSELKLVPDRGNLDSL